MTWAATMLVSPTQAAGFIIQVWTQRRDLQTNIETTETFDTQKWGVQPGLGQILGVAFQHENITISFVSPKS